MRRQQAAVASLARLPAVEGLNLQFRTGPPATLPGIETRAVLVQDSLAISGPDGRRKPMTRELLDVCADEAASRGHTYFAYINSDIVVLPAAIERVEREGRATYAISRCDVEAGDDGSNGSLLTAGLDMFVWSVGWWRNNRRRFRSYVVGDACWDNVYTAITMCHSNGAILNRDRLILHERHDARWHDRTPTARYNGFLAALDARYFSLWCTYFDRLERLRRERASAEAEQALRDEVFVWQRSAADALRQSIRNIRARVRRLIEGG
jgi:hypothetical protein